MVERAEGSGTRNSKHGTRNPRPYEQAGQALGQLVQAKNDAYGDSINATGEALRLLFPAGIRPEQYRDLGLIVRVWDKLKRIATDRDALGESPWQDIAGYGLLGARIQTTDYRPQATGASANDV